MQLDLATVLNLQKLILDWAATVQPWLGKKDTMTATALRLCLESVFTMVAVEQSLENLHYVVSLSVKIGTSQNAKTS